MLSKHQCKAMTFQGMPWRMLIVRLQPFDGMPTKRPDEKFYLFSTYRETCLSIGLTWASLDVDRRLQPFPRRPVDRRASASIGTTWCTLVDRLSLKMTCIKRISTKTFQMAPFHINFNTKIMKIRSKISREQAKRMIARRS